MRLLKLSLRRLTFDLCPLTRECHEFQRSMHNLNSAPKISSEIIKCVRLPRGCWFHPQLSISCAVPKGDILVFWISA